MKQFRNLTGSDAKLEFALVVLHGMPDSDAEAVAAIFEEGRASEILEPSILDMLQKGALEILPVKFFYGEGEEEQMKRFADYRDKILHECGIG